ncbi:hypothetical protein, partial [Faecalibacterium prausnitzii]
RQRGGDPAGGRGQRASDPPQSRPGAAAIWQARQGGGRCWLLHGWQCAGGAVGRGGLLYAGIGQAGGAGMVCSRQGGGGMPCAAGARRALAAAGGAV